MGQHSEFCLIHIVRVYTYQQLSPRKCVCPNYETQVGGCCRRQSAPRRRRDLPWIVASYFPITSDSTSDAGDDAQVPFESSS